MTLEEIIRDAVARGEMNHLSLSGNGKTFRADFRPASNFEHSVAEHKDPIEALKRAITECKMARRKHVNITETPATDDAAPAEDVDFG